MSVLYILIAILAFGILIAGHELGHFLVAKACGIKVNEFAIGMGPAVWKKQKGETLYALRCLPVGGYCAMEGEDENTGDPRAFTAQPAWKRFLVLAAGAAMNFVMGFLLLVIIFGGSESFVGNTVTELVPGFMYEEGGIQAGDVIWSIDGSRIYYSSDFSLYMSRAGETVDMVVIRDGEKLLLDNYALKPHQYEDGYRYGLTFNLIKANMWEKLRYSAYCSWDFVRQVWMGLSDLVRGAVGLNEMSGVVGIVDVIGQVGNQSPTVVDALANIGYLIAFIAVNLAVMNLLPIPALDGGRIFFLVITWVVETVFRRKINPKYEGYVHAAGLVLLLGLMAVVCFNDVLRIIRR